MAEICPRKDNNIGRRRKREKKRGRGALQLSPCIALDNILDEKGVFPRILVQQRFFFVVVV